MSEALNEKTFLAARDVAEIEFTKYRDAGVSVGGAITAAVRVALYVLQDARVAAGAGDPPETEMRSMTPEERAAYREFRERRRAGDRPPAPHEPTEREMIAAFEALSDFLDYYQSDLEIEVGPALRILVGRILSAHEPAVRPTPRAAPRDAILEAAVLAAHRRFHGKVGCPGGDDCYVCRAEEELHAAGAASPAAAPPQEEP